MNDADARTPRPTPRRRKDRADIPANVPTDPRQKTAQATEKLIVTADAAQDHTRERSTCPDALTPTAPPRSDRPKPRAHGSPPGQPDRRGACPHDDEPDDGRGDLPVRGGEPGRARPGNRADGIADDRRAGPDRREGNGATRRRTWTVEEVVALGTTTDLPTAMSVLGIGQTSGYHLANTGQFPVPIKRAGRRYIVAVPELLRAIGINPDLHYASAPPSPLT